MTRRQALCWLAAIVAASPLVACGQATNPNAPPPIRYGEDVCVSCNMIISEPGYASAYRTVDGEARLFDDLGEMVLYNRALRENVQAFFVHHVETRGWLRAEGAFYVQSRALRTPMGFGIAAVATEAEARALAERVGGTILDFPSLMEQADLPGPRGGRMEGDGHPAGGGGMNR